MGQVTQSETPVPLHCVPHDASQAPQLVLLVRNVCAGHAARQLPPCRIGAAAGHATHSVGAGPEHSLHCSLHGNTCRLASA